MALALFTTLISMFRIVNPETTWTTDTFSSGFTIANIFFYTTDHVENDAAANTAWAALSFTICAGLLSCN
jgi:hypothetical protein